MPKNIPSNLQLEATLDIQAQDGGESKGPPKISMIANTGKPMQLAGFMEPVVIDMTGAKFDKKKTPILMDHDTSKRIGFTESQAIEPNRIVADGIAMSSMGIAAGVVEDARNGFPFQVSVGATIDKGFFVDEGDTATVNGKAHKGPLIVASKTRIREISLTVLGADNNTSASIVAAAMRNESSSKEREAKMTFEEFVASLGLDLTAMDADQTSKLKAQWEKMNKLEAGTPGGSNPPNGGGGVNTPPVSRTSEGNPDDEAFNNRRKRIAAEEARVDTIRATASRYSETLSGEFEVDGKKTTVASIKATAINDGWDPDKLELTLLRASRDVDAPSGGNGGPAIHMGRTIEDLDNRAIACAIVRQSGKVPANRRHDVTGEEFGYEHDYPEAVLEASDHRSLRNASLHQILDFFNIMANGHGFHGNRRTDEFIQATRASMQKLQASSGVTTLQANQIFEDAANKLLWAGYQSVNTTWQEWVRPVNVNDFKTQNVYRMTHEGAYQQVGPDGELKHGGFSDQKYTVAADTYGKIVGMTRHHLINDDLGAFNDMMTALGIEAAKTIEESGYVTLLGQVGTFWTGGNGNLSSGAGSDLTIAGLSAAQQLFEDQVDSDNAPIMIEPDRILVGTQDRVQAGQLFNDTEVREGPSSTSTQKEFTRNPHTSAFRPVVTPYLNNTAILQRVANIGSAIPNQDGNQWFMFGNPAMAQGASFMIAFLNGNRTPILESSDASFNVLGLQWRAYHDFGYGLGDPKMSVRSAGA